MFEIDRYATPAMRELWSFQSKIDLWCKIEVEAARVSGAPDHVIEEFEKVKPDLARIKEREKFTRHDVGAFVHEFGVNLSEDAQSWLHRYLTSSDVVDTANAVRLDRSIRLINTALWELINAVTAQAIEHWGTARLARTHGQPAEESTLGYRLGEFALMLNRCQGPLSRAHVTTCVGRFAGPVGNYRYVSPAHEEAFCHAMGVESAGSGTQVVSRDRYADYVYALARIASVVESIALELRLSNLHGIGELWEPSGDTHTVGSSAMPHKVNPVVSEGIAGLSRAIRAYVPGTLESVPLWFERDISHSSFERFSLPTVSALAESMLHKAVTLVFDLRVDADRMATNLDSARSDVVSAHRRVLLQESGMTYANAWAWVNENPDPTEFELRQIEFDMRRPETLPALQQVNRLHREAQTVLRMENL